jgi:hypothetical protein
MNRMDRSAILHAFEELAGELHQEGLQADIFVVGGAAITIAFEERAATRDVDAPFTAAGQARTRYPSSAHVHTKTRQVKPDHAGGKNRGELLPGQQ